ncbi:BirA family biotin operon repressor/biotin-[acetyl-CoA-carboxylase] ligase [Sediminihabitans luteus]|uniref:BirA family biotin operon repressor/biotin-[acetyl-CoA-carboxylase] ligase n=1 Tax=Sediminihabitans luteus TaxID=1138585 RepID=A0A2M9CYW8_9CELL|nr:biotin--[acetyl-CoA-carboxylase] ligase [Sediminihabitans luteus]PJJ76938.1 BirA family biotin operon repressor/biotin-[acetyl-CoA-carboxylase] ligase [Sediminihabitans luteus]GII99579.1 biotin--[acetyl-CoA-carboxylase] ligase [Sediminihabitans luteus]
MSTPREPLRAQVLQQMLVGPGLPLRRVEVVEESTSTMVELAAARRADPEAWPTPSLLVAEHQSAGRGRAGRSWQTAPRAALLASILLRPQVPAAALTWLPLLAGLATVRAVRATAGVEAVLKWPNDVLVEIPGAEPVDGWGTLRKLGGILTEVQPDGTVVLGVGVNVSQSLDELPVGTATSLALAGAATLDREVLLVALQEAFSQVAERWRDADGDALAAGLADEVAQVCATLGAQVAIERVDGSVLVGEAVGIGAAGELVVRPDGSAHGDDDLVAVVSGDVRHLRLDGGR